MSEKITPETCPERENHGRPFRYCPVKGCGWMEPVEPMSLADAEAALEVATENYRDALERERSS